MKVFLSTIIYPAGFSGAKNDNGKIICDFYVDDFS